MLLRGAVAEAGAWMQGPGQSYSKFSVTVTSADHQIDQAGRVSRMADGGRYEETAFGYYVERGLLDRLDLVSSLSFKRSEFRNDQVDDATTGLADLYLGGRLGALELQSFLISGLASLKLPLGYDEGDRPPLGAGQLDLEARLLVSRSLPRLSGYVTGEIGYRWRRDFANESPYFAEFGIDLSGGTWLRLTAIGSNSLGEAAPAGEELALVTREEDYLKIGPGLTLPLDAWLGLELAYWQVVSGKNTIESRDLAIGLSFTGGGVR